VNQATQDPCELAEIVFEKPLAGAFEEISFGSDKANTLWVKFSDKNGVNEWIGKFGVGGSGPERVLKIVEPDRFFISAPGFAYLVDATERKLVNQYSNRNACDITYDQNRQSLIVADYTQLHWIEFGDKVLFSRKIAVDGIRDLKIEGNVLSGFATSNYGGEEERFRFDLDSLKILSWEKVSLKISHNKKPWWKFW
jgi:hypothetical protein